MKTIWLLCGTPGSGKSTWAKEQVEARMNRGGEAIWLSRDVIRFSMLKDSEDYFAHEDEVFGTFIDYINKGIEIQVEHIYVDATHLNETARNKVLDKLNLDGYVINPVNFRTSLSKCLEYNEQREGRALVPRSVVKRMFYSFKPAAHGEKHPYNLITEIINGGDDNV